MMKADLDWTDNPWIQSLRTWDWDLWDLWTHWMDTAWYYLDTIGWPAYIGLGVFLVFVGLSLDLTHQWTSNMLSRVFGAATYAIMTLGGMIVGWVGLILNRFLLARLRDVARLFRDYRKRRPR